MESMVMNSSFWNGKKVFVTGHTGFKGSWLCLWLKKSGADVVGYALEPSTSPSLFHVADVEKGMNSIIGDIRDCEKLGRALSEAAPDIVIHMAAQALVRYSYEQPVETYEVNVMGTVNLLEAVRSCKSVRAVLVVTSDKCYENREWVWGYRENEPMGGHDPYSSSKGCAELIVSAYRNSFFNQGSSFVSIASARAGNVIGGGDWSEDRLIPDLVRAFSSNHSARIRNPNAIRPWQHVLEALNGYLILIEKMHSKGEQFSEGWNFGPDDTDAKPVSWLADTLVSHWGTGQWSTETNLNAPHEAYTLRLDSSKAKSKLHWTPTLKLELALKWIAEWYRCYYDGGNVKALSENQIEAFQNQVNS